MKCEREGWREEKFWEQFFTLDKINAMILIGNLSSWYGDDGHHVEYWLLVPEEAGSCDRIIINILIYKY